MWGAIIGDIVGSMYEWDRIKTKRFELFGAGCDYTDDTVCSAAVAEILLDDAPAAPTLQQWCRRHPGRGYGGMFAQWIRHAVPEPYGSYGNGAALRVSPTAYLNRYRILEDALEAADRVTAITHDHPEGLDREPLEGKASFSSVVAEARRAIPPVHLVLNPTDCTVTAVGESLVIPRRAISSPSMAYSS